MQTNQITKEEWMRTANDAVNQFDAAKANKLLRIWKTVHGSEVSGKQPDGRLDLLRKNLLFTAFPLLSTELASVVLKECLVDFLKSEEELLDPIEKIELRIKAAGYGLYDQERELMKSAILLNGEIVGSFTFGEWIKRFEKLAQSKEEDKEIVKTFLTKDSEVVNLGKNEQAILQTLFFMYENWLRVPVTSIFDLATLVSDDGTQTRSRSRLAGQSGMVRLPLLQALSKYEQLGNQLITNERIKVKSQTEPVRPSLLYWIKYYRDELGVGHHDSVQRGDFLFRSENGKRLSPEERERVNLVLKSVEENFPLEIDTEQSLVLFPTFVAPQAPRPVPQTAAPSRMAPLQNSASFHFGTTTMNAPKTAAPEQSGTLSFSSKHVLPAEKAQAIPQERTAPEPQNMPQRMAPRAPMPKANPFHIRPVSLGKEE